MIWGLGIGMLEKKKSDLMGAIPKGKAGSLSTVSSPYRSLSSMIKYIEDPKNKEFIKTVSCSCYCNCNHTLCGFIVGILCMDLWRCGQSVCKCIGAGC